MNLQQRLNRLEAVLRHKGKPTYDEYRQAYRRSQTRVREQVEYDIAVAYGQQATKPAFDQKQDEIDQDIIRTYEDGTPVQEDINLTFTNKITRLAERLKGAANNESER